MNPENVILAEAADRIRDCLGDRLDDVQIERAVLGLFFTGVKLNTGQGGLCFTPVKEMPEAVCCPSSARMMPQSGRLRGTTGSKMLSWLFDKNPLKAALGIASLNALTEYCSEPGCVGRFPVMDGGVDAFDTIDVSDYGYSVVIGALVPMMKRLKVAKREWSVLEQDAVTLKGEELEHYVPAERYVDVVPKADLLVITGVTILNNTLTSILDIAKPGAEIIVTGPTASMDPGPLFDRGVTIVGGLRVTDADATLDIISEAGSGYHMFGRCAERTVVRATNAKGRRPLALL